MNSYNRDIRRIINKGMEMGYRDRTILLNEANNKEIEDFKLIYFSTLDRKHANKFYYFNEDYFSRLRQKLSRNILFSIIYDGDKAISASINPFLGVIGYGFLGGSLTEYKKISPFTFMIHKIVLKFKEMGIKNYLLGGGSNSGDSIFKYKKSFAKDGLFDFYIGKKIYNKKIYNSVCKAWEKKFPEKKDRYHQYLLKYRY
jgi:hypothetical protein